MHLWYASESVLFNKIPAFTTFGAFTYPGLSHNGDCNLISHIGDCNLITCYLEIQLNYNLISCYF